MKVQNKENKAQKTVQNKRLIVVVITVVATLILVVSLYEFYPEQPSQPKAAIIDQLSSSTLTSSSRYVNQTFIDEAKALLYTHFPEVDYYSDNATVDNYKSLPSMGYKLLIWRAHSALDNAGFIAISTSETNSTKDYPQYSNGELTLCNIRGDPRMYFAITPKFITEVMSGRFENTVIILMSCNGLREGYTKTAEAFIEKGAKVFISWDEWVETNDNDNAIELLLEHLITENNTINQAVGKIPEQPGPSHLSYYPRTAADYRIQNYNQNQTTASLTGVVRRKSNLRLRLTYLSRKTSQPLRNSQIQLIAESIAC